MNTKDKKNKTLRLEPQSIDAEKAVLGSMLISKEAVPRAMGLLIDNSFYDQKNKIIYQNIVLLYHLHINIF